MGMVLILSVSPALAEGYGSIEHLPEKVAKPLQELEAIRKSLAERVESDLQGPSDAVGAKIAESLHRFTAEKNKQSIEYWQGVRDKWAADRSLVIVPSSIEREYGAYLNARRRLLKKGLLLYVEKDRETALTLKNFQNTLAASNDYDAAIAIEEALERMEGERVEVSRQLGSLSAASDQKPRPPIPINASNRGEIEEQTPQGRQHLKLQGFQISSEDRRSHVFEVEIPRSALGDNFRFGVYGAADTSGDQGLEVIIVNPKGEAVIRELTKEKGWKFFDVEPEISGRWGFQLVDEDTSFSDDSPGNSGAVVVVRAPKP